MYREFSWGRTGIVLVTGGEVAGVLTEVERQSTATTLTQLSLTVRCACYHKNSIFRDIFKHKHQTLSNDLHDSVY